LSTPVSFCRSTSPSWRARGSSFRR
jgi:hypothetical protein